MINKHMMEVFMAYKADRTKEKLQACIDAGWKVMASENVGAGAMDTCDPFAYASPDIVQVSKDTKDTMYIAFL